MRTAAAQSPTRDLDWEGCFNVREVGGLRTTDGRVTRSGALVRADELPCLTAAGWRSLRAHGIRTVVDLRNDDERELRPPPATAGIEGVSVPLDDVADAEFWRECRAQELDGTPLFYRPFLERKPDSCAAAVRAVARARPGGVAIHCVGGRDRTGLVVVLLLALARVEPDEIVRDYERSNERLPDRWAAFGEQDHRPEIERILAARDTTAAEVLHDLLAWLDAETYLLSAGLDARDVDAVRARLVS